MFTRACAVLTLWFVVLGGIFSSPAYGAEPVDFERFCKFEYIIQDDIRTCSLVKLSATKLRFLEIQLGNAEHIYIDFLREKGMKVGDTIKAKFDVKIYMIDDATINDGRYFKRKRPNEKVAGRYFDYSGDLFITERVFDRGDGYTDLPHEVAHYMNDLLGVRGPKNEQFAMEFESYYKEKMKSINRVANAP